MLFIFLLFSGKITYYTHPPETAATHVSAEFVTQMGQEFDIAGLLEEEQKIVDSKSALILSYHFYENNLQYFS